MNESDFENELRALVPARPSEALAQRIARDLQPARATAIRGLRAGMIAPARPRNLLARIFPATAWLATGAAAALLAVVAIHTQKTTPTAPTAPLEIAAATAEPKPADLGEIATSRELVTATEEELLLDADQEPARRMRFTFIERHTWTDPESGDSVEVQIPREDVLIVPVAMQ